VAIGERLREARLRQSVDIADVETATKIRAKYLRALEHEDFGLLPGSTFVKTFLRTYAEYLGLDAQLLVEEYRAEHEPRGEGEMQPFVPPSRRRPARERRPRAPAGPPGAGTAIVVAVSVLLVIFAILGITGGSGGSKNESVSQPRAKRPAARRPAPPRKPAKPVLTAVRLKLVPAHATYVCVDRGKGSQKVYEGITSSTLRFKGRHLRVNAGNTQLRVFANGKRVRIQRSSNPVGLDFTSRRTKPIPTGQRPCA
jgi:cytoskeleton protein RodZ